MTNIVRCNSQRSFFENENMIFPIICDFDSIRVKGDFSAENSWPFAA